MGFELPPGDPDALDSAVKRLGAIQSDLQTTAPQVRSGFAAALTTWHGTRSEDFRSASAGMQLQVAEGESAVTNVTAGLKAYAKVLRSNTDQIKTLKRQADTRNTQADTFAKKHAQDANAVQLEYQHAASYVGSLSGQAETLRSEVKRAARATAGVVDASTDTAIPHSEKLSPAEIARRVNATTGIAGIQSALATGTLTEADAWGALKTASTEVPKDAINSDGSINSEQLLKDVKAEAKDEAADRAKGIVDTTNDLWTLAVSGPGAWSLKNLVHAALEFTQAKSQLPPDLYRMSQQQLDAVPKGPAEDPLTILDQIENPKFTAADERAFQAASNLTRSEEALGGLEKIAKVGRVFDGLAAVGDIWTLFDPKSQTDDRWDAGINLGGLALTTEVGSGLAGDALVASGLLAANASLDWIPVVGWALAIGTAGYEVYKHWHEITKLAGKAWHATTNFVTNTVPHLASSAVHHVGHFLSSINPF